MLQISYFKPIKDKQIKFLYETFTKHLHNIEKFKSIEACDQYANDLKAFMNGHTKKDPLFKDLRKAIIPGYKFYPEVLLEFVKFKSLYLKNPRVKTLEDLYLYTAHQSSFGFLLLSLGDSFQKPLKLIETLGIIDGLSNILTNFHALNKQGLIHFPFNLIQDYDIDFDLDGNFLINDKFIHMWDMIAYKVLMLINEVQLTKHQFDELNQMLVDTFIKDIKSGLARFEQAEIKNKR